MNQLPKCDANARANEPKPPRVTPDSELLSLDATRLDEESPLKKLLRDHDPPDPPWPPPEEPRGAHTAPACWSAAIPGRGPQFSPGISA